MNNTDCPIRIKCATKNDLRELSLTYDIDGRPTESYDSIIRRTIAAIKTQQTSRKIDMSLIQ